MVSSWVCIVGDRRLDPFDEWWVKLSEQCQRLDGIPTDIIKNFALLLDDIAFLIKCEIVFGSQI